MYGRKERNGAIELYRFVFSIIIMLRHVKTIFPKSVFPPLFQRGAIGVDFFFIVSGYLMSEEILKNRKNTDVSTCTQTIRYLRQKLGRMLPELWIAICLSFIMYCIRIRVDSFARIIFESINWIWCFVPLDIAGFSGRSFHMGLWYISTMLLCIYLLYPFCSHFYDLFIHILGPMIAISILGYLHKATGSILGPFYIIGVFYKGFLRGFAEISLGIFIFPLSKRLSAVFFTKLGKLIMTSIVISLTIFIAYHAVLNTKKSMDLICVFSIAAMITIVFSNQCLYFDKLNCDICYMLGKCSFLIYISHVELAVLISKIVRENNWGVFIANPIKKCAIALLLYFMGTAFIMVIIKLISRIMRLRLNKIMESIVVRPK